MPLWARESCLVLELQRRTYLRLWRIKMSDLAPRIVLKRKADSRRIRLQNLVTSLTYLSVFSCFPQNLAPSLCPSESVVPRGVGLSVARCSGPGS